MSFFPNRNIILVIPVVLTALFINMASASELNTNSNAELSFESISNDYDAFYSSERLTRLGIAFASMSVFANTSIDENVQNSYQDNVRSASTDDLARFAKIFGEGKIFIPLSFLSAGLKYWDADSAIGNWGVNVSRAYVVGGPAMLLMQQVTGGSRPNETEYDSQWRFFADSNGVSGHAFMGSVPFLTIAKMNEDNAALKYGFYAASVFTAWSRVNDNKHYLSQAILGWYMGWESVNAVSDSNRKKQTFTMQPMLYNDVYGMSLKVQW